MMNRYVSVRYIVNDDDDNNDDDDDDDDYYFCCSSSYSDRWCLWSTYT